MKINAGSYARVVIFGNPLIDLYAEVSEEGILAAGIQPGGIIHRETTENSDLYAFSQRIYDGNMIFVSRANASGIIACNGVRAYPGGGAFTAARLLAGAGYSVLFCGAVGTDKGADLFRRAAETSGLELLLSEDEGFTGCCRYLQSSGSPDAASSGLQDTFSIIVSPGVSQKYSITREGAQAAEKADWIYIEGFALSYAGRILRDLPETVNAAVDLGSPFVVEGCRDLLLGAIDNRRMILFGTGEEFSALFQCPIGEVESRCLEWVGHARDFACNYVIKYGEKGVVSINQDGRMFHEAPDIGNHVEHFRKTSIRTIGAGDAFAAGYITGKIRRKHEAVCLGLATDSAALALAVEGPPFS